MRAITWNGENDCTIDGVHFHCAVGDYSQTSDAERFILLKDRVSLDQYARALADEQPKNILEFGVFQGGSPVLFSLCFDVDKFVGIDISEPVPALDDFCRDHPIGRKIRCYYRTSQIDQERIERIVRTEFGAAPVDLIIDDASHQYEHSRRTFEIAFPLLRSGGTYVIEDWGWAHWPQGRGVYVGETPLSLLIMELTMLCASRSDLISEIRLFPGFAFIRKAPHAPVVARLQLEGLYLKRGIEIVAAQKPNVSGLVRLAVLRIGQRIARRLRRTRDKLMRAARRLRT